MHVTLPRPVFSLCLPLGTVLQKACVKRTEVPSHQGSCLGKLNGALKLKQKTHGGQVPWLYSLSESPFSHSLPSFMFLPLVPGKIIPNISYLYGQTPFPGLELFDLLFWMCNTKADQKLGLFFHHWIQKYEPQTLYKVIFSWQLPKYHTSNKLLFKLSTNLDKILHVVFAALFALLSLVSPSVIPLKFQLQ